MSRYTSSPLGIIDHINRVGGRGFEYDQGNKDSLFTSHRDGTNKHTLNANSKGVNPVLGSSPHSSQIYDISTINILTQLSSNPATRLSPVDFAYLKDLGVYPNNRLIIARRFGKPVVDDIYSLDLKSFPISTVIGWVPEGSDFIKLNVSEVWTDAEVSFKTLLNDLGNDFGFKLGGGLGNILEGAVNAVPMPGATLLLQRKIMESLGIIEKNEAAVIPQGDPNLIKEAKVRSLIKEDAKGSGLKGTISITLTTTYEQKFIGKADPTVVFMDILNNVLNMGTSNATFYLGKQVDAKEKLVKWYKEFSKDPINKIKEFIKSLVKELKGQVEKLGKAISGEASETKEKGPTAILDSILSLVTAGTNSVAKYIETFIVAKYKIQFMGIVSALTGAASTPWHVTVGNPLRPTFCSGDMLCSSVTVDFGPQLSFNDLPTYITVKVTLTSARNLGLQEIFSKFNTGSIRTTNGEYLVSNTKSFWTDSTDPGSTQSVDPVSSAESTGDVVNTTNVPDISDVETKVVDPLEGANVLPEVTITPDNLESQVNTDPNSDDSPILVAGSDDESQKLREDNQIETKGEIDGFVDQKEDISDSPNDGVDAEVIEVKKWIPEKVRNSGGYNKTGLKVNWEVRNDYTPGWYEVFVDGEEYASYPDIDSASEAAREKAGILFEERGGFKVQKEIDVKSLPFFLQNEEFG